jgi:hypothetical protein
MPWDLRNALDEDRRHPHAPLRELLDETRRKIYAVLAEEG